MDALHQNNNFCQFTVLRADHCLSIFIYYKQLTAFDLIYFLGETAIICLLVYIELTVSAKLLKQ